MKGIFSGSGGKTLLDELARGTSGTMPACEFVDVDAQIYNLAAAGKWAEARALFQKLLPMIILEETYGVAFCKAVTGPARRLQNGQAAWCGGPGGSRLG